MNQKGQSLVETALVLAAFMGVMLAIVDLGQRLFLRQSLLDRVQTAARWGARHPYNAEAIRARVLNGAVGDLRAADVIVSTPGCPGPACRVRVVITNAGIDVSSQVEQQIE